MPSEGELPDRRARGLPVRRLSRTISDTLDLDDARHLWNGFLSRCKESAANLIAWIEQAIPDGCKVFGLPASDCRQLRTIRLTGRSGNEIKGRTRAIRLFANEAACLRPVYAVLEEIPENWHAADKRYFVIVDEEKSGLNSHKGSGLILQHGPDNCRIVDIF